MEAKFYIFAFCLLSLFSARSSVWAEDSEEVNVNLGAANSGQTDFDAASQKERSTSDTGYSAEELKVIEATRENHSFEAEVNKMMGIIINSLYSNSEIFLRELISNASDALHKIRYKAITDKSILDRNPDLSIKIKADPEAKTLTITDAGVGMTKEELVNNLGTIAQSGTSSFIKGASNDADSLELIGQFGVGFYAAFLVADKVEVHSKSNDSDKQYIWDASSQSTYTVYEDPKQDLGRGTSIVLHIKESAMEYLEDSRLRTLISQYSEFIDFPIYLWSSHVEEVQPEVTADDDDDDDEMDVEDVEDGEEPEIEKVTVWDYEHVNDLKPLWARKPSEVSDEDYNNFYKGFTKDSQDPLAYEHFSTEGDINFRGLLYIPDKAPADILNPSTRDEKTNLKLYVKRVFITDNFSEIIPRYLRFIAGVIDSDDLPLNVSREMLQKNRLLTLMKKKLIRKAIAMIQNIAKNEEKYLEFFNQYGTFLKLGILDHPNDTNTPRLEKLLRFQSSATDNLTSFEAYVERMKEGQEQIYFYAAQDEKENMMKSPLLERLLSKGYEVLFMTEPIDEYVFQHQLAKFDGKVIVNVAKDDVVKLPEDKEEAEDENSIEELEKEDSWKILMSYVKDAISPAKGVQKVRLTDRLTSSPCVVSSFSSVGWTGNMQKLAMSQALGEEHKSPHNFYRIFKTIELNPRHPVVIELKNRIVSGEKSEQLVDITNLMFESALLSSGYELVDRPSFADRINNVLRLGLGLEVEYPEPAAPQEESEDVESLDPGRFDEL